MGQRADEMKSTPVSAIARTVSSVTPPDASSAARPATSATASPQLRRASCCRAGSASAPASSASRDLRRACRTSTSIGRPRRRRAGRSTAAAIAAGDAQVVLLDQDRVVRARSGGSSRRRSAPRASRARAARASSCACRGSSRRCRRRRPRSGASASRSRDRRPRKLSAVRSPVSTARAGPSTRATARPASAESPSVDERLEGPRVELGEDASAATSRPHDDTRLLEQEPRRARRVLVDDGLARDVAVARRPRRASARPSAPRSAPWLERRLLPGPEDDVRTGEALGPRPGSRCGSGRRGSPRAGARSSPRGARADARERARRSSPARVTDEAGVEPHRRAQLGRHGDRRLGLRRSAGVRRQRRFFARRRARRGGRRRGTRAASSRRAGWRRGRPCRRTRRRRTGRQPVAPVEVGDDPAHRVVGGRRDRDRLRAGS